MFLIVAVQFRYIVVALAPACLNTDIETAKWFGAGDALREAFGFPPTTPESNELRTASLYANRLLCFAGSFKSATAVFPSQELLAFKRAVKDAHGEEVPTAARLAL